jgi:hypothetical protein
MRVEHKYEEGRLKFLMTVNTLYRGAVMAELAIWTTVPN